MATNTTTLNVADSVTIEPSSPASVVANSVPSVLVCNDAAQLNTRYRAPLMDALRERGTEVSSVGLFEGGFPRLLTWLKVALTRAPVLSSNLRCNLAIMALAHKRGLVIVNGLGRHRTKPVLRRILLALLAINGRKAIAFQNYADFRWARRFASHKDMHWVPGSGGARKSVGSAAALTVVTRDDKVPVIAPSLKELFATEPNLPPLAIVGCKDPSSLSAHMGAVRYQSFGFVDPEAILSFGDGFLQPSGYGEGLPHSLVDALVSGVKVIIRTRDMTRYGLRRLGLSGTPISDGWHAIEASETVRADLSREAITIRYLELLDEAIHRN